MHHKGGPGHSQHVVKAFLAEIMNNAVREPPPLGEVGVIVERSDSRPGLEDFGPVHVHTRHKQIDLMDQLVVILIFRRYIVNVTFIDGFVRADVVQLAPGNADDGVAFGV